MYAVFRNRLSRASRGLVSDITTNAMITTTISRAQRFRAISVISDQSVLSSMYANSTSSQPFLASAFLQSRSRRWTTTTAASPSAVNNRRSGRLPASLLPASPNQIASDLLAMAIIQTTGSQIADDTEAEARRSRLSRNSTSAVQSASATGAGMSSFRACDRRAEACVMHWTPGHCANRGYKSQSVATGTACRSR